MRCAALAALLACAPGCAGLVPRGAPPREALLLGSRETPRADSSGIAGPLAVVWSRGIGRGVSAAPVGMDSLVVLGTADRRLLALRLADGARVWIRGTRGPFTADLAAVGPVVYAVSDWREGMLRALSGARGGVAWTRGVGASQAAPFVTGDRVLVSTLEGRVVAVSRADGHVLWERALAAPLIASPVAADSLVAVASLSGLVTLLRPADGSVADTVRVARGAGADLIVYGGRIITASLAGGVEARTLAGGTLLWRRSLSGGAAAAARDGDEIVALSSGGTLTRLRIADGGELWTRQLPGSFRHSLTVGARAILVGGADGSLRAFDRDGRLRAEWNAGEPLLAPALLRQGRVFVAGSHGHAWLLGPAAGAEEGTTASAGETSTLPAFAQALEGRRTELAAGPPPAAAPVLFSSPSGAEVRRGTAPLGTTPLRLAPFAPPGDTLRLRYPGFATLSLPEDSLRDLALRTEPLRFQLRPEPGPKSGPSPAPGRWARPAFVSLAAAAATAVAAVVAKDHADHVFDRYRRTADLDLARREFDSAERWDRVSVAAWGTTQVATALGIYFLARRDEEASRPADPARGWGKP